MLSLDNLKQIAVKIRFPLGIILMVLVFIALIFFRFPPKTQGVPVNIEVSDTLPSLETGSRVLYSGKEIEIPLNSSIAKIASHDLSEPVLEQIAVNLGFSSKPERFPTQSGQMALLWESDIQSLIVNPENNSIQYETPVTSSPTLNPSPNNYQTLFGFLNKIGVDINNINTDNPHVKYFQEVNENEKEVDQSEARFINLNYFTNFQGVPIISDNPTGYPIQTILTTAGEIKRVVLDLSIYQTYEPAQVAENKTFAQILKELHEGRITIISSFGEETPRFLPDGPTKFQKIDFQESFLTYYQDKKGESLIPVVLFKGKGTFVNESEEEVQAVIPTINNAQITKSFQ